MADSAGHFTASAGNGPATGDDGSVSSFGGLGQPQAPTFQQRMESIRLKAVAAAKITSERAAATTAQLRQKVEEKDWTKEREYLGRTQKNLQGAAEKASTWVWAASSRTANVLRGDAVSTLARTESTTRPCPRVVLVVCTAIVSSGLEQVGLFREDESASQEVIGFMLNSFEDGFGVFLPPAGTTPHTLAAVLLHFLTTLPEPLLTFKTLPAVIAAGDISADTAALAPPLLMELPAANLNALWLLLEMLARVAGNAAVNEMDAQALAEVFTPKLAWHAPPKVTAKGPSYSPMGDANGLGVEEEEDAAPGTPEAHRTELTEEETASVARVLQYFVANFAALNRRVYWTPSGQPALLPD